MNDTIKSFRDSTPKLRLQTVLLFISFFIHSLISSFNSQAKEVNTDSLKNALTNSADELNTFNILHDLFYNYIDQDSIQSNFYAGKIETFSKETKDKNLLSRSYSLLADYNGLISNYIRSKEYYELAVRLNLELQDTVDYANNLFNLGLTHDYLGDYVTALNYYQQSLSIAEGQNNKLDIAEILGNIAVLYSNQEDYEKSINFLQRGLDINKELENKEAISMSLGNLGAVFHDLSVQKKDSTMLLKALDYYQQALEIQNELDDQNSVAWINGNIGLLYNDLGKYDLAIEYVQKCLAISESINDKSSQATAYGNLSEIFCNQMKFNKALDYQLKSLNLGDLINDKLILLSAYEGLSKIYSGLNNYELAYKYHTKFKASQDSLYDVNKNSKFNELISLYESNKKEQAINELKTEKKLNELEIKQQKSQLALYIISAFSLLLLTLTLLYFYLRIRKSQSKLKYTNDQLVLSKQKLSSLNETKDRFFAIIAHDLRGSLTSFQGIGQVIKNHLEKNRLERISTVADRIDSSAKQLNSLLDNLLNWAVTQLGDVPFNPKKLNLRKEIDNAIEAFQESSTARNIEITTDILNELTIYADQNGLSIVLRNILSNALKFTEEGGHIRITSAETATHSQISISDTGIGIPAHKICSLFEIDDKKSTSGLTGEKGTGLGLVLCKEFASLHHGNISVESEVGIGSTFTFSLPRLTVVS